MPADQELPSYEVLAALVVSLRGVACTSPAPGSALTLTFGEPPWPTQKALPWTLKWHAWGI